MEGDANAKKVIDAKIGEDVVFDRYEFCTFTAHGERVRLVASTPDIHMCIMCVKIPKGNLARNFAEGFSIHRRL
jgi:hypothetical protein